MAGELVLPTFFVIGAAKAGTTSLHSYLALHPEIAMTDPKEPHVLVGGDHRRRARWYADLFAEELPIRGESSTGYSVIPDNPDVPGNIADLVPDARIIYLVRDPVERAIAHYAQGVTVGRERRGIEEALAPGEGESHFVAASCYATQLEAYLRHFPQEAILVLDSELLKHRRRESVSAVLRHVGADPGYWHPGYEREHMVRAVDNVQLGPTVLRLRRSTAAALYRRLLPGTVRERLRPRLRRLLGGREVRPEPSGELRGRLAERLGPEADRFRRLTGRRFADWSV